MGELLGCVFAIIFIVGLCIWGTALMGVAFWVLVILPLSILVAIARSLGRIGKGCQ